MNHLDSQFICEEIETHFDVLPVRMKTPPCSNGFTWRGKKYRVVENMKGWSDFIRRGRLAHNMTPTHADAASQYGSFGIGRLYFRVRTDSKQVFNLYYDRQVKNVDDRLGHWFLLSEICD